ncbi:MAG TPA: hypothetical protein VGP95_20890 [Gemmatimonadaceae bacterium]|nr:hypothetical protein [Gemmatimonadaceae bacterium]
MRCDLRRSALVLLALSALACSDSGMPASPTPTLAKEAPRAIRLIIVPDSVTLALSATVSFAAYTVMSDSSRVPVVPQWNSTNFEILALNPANAYAVAVGPGHAAVMARFDNFTAVAPVTVLAALTSGSADALIIDSFSMIEYKYNSASTRWSYSPQMRARAPTGHKVSVLVMKFAIPGLGGVPTFGCGANLTDVPRDLFGEVYGDWLLEIDGSAQQVAGATATVTVTFVDESGATGTRVVSGPITQGTLPTTYSGGQNGGACFHGYGSTG